jgi:hypothetical protein
MAIKIQGTTVIDDSRNFTANDVTLGTQSNKLTLNYTTNTARTYTFPDAGTNANIVMTAGNQTIGGTKTFSSTISGSINGTAANVTGTVAIANGGTGGITAQAARNNLAGAVTSGQFLRGNGTNVLMSAIQASDIPTLNQNTTGTASNVTGTVAVANGGTGATTATDARTNLGVNNATLTLSTSGIATGSQTWTSNQGTNATFTVSVPATNLSVTAGTTAGPTINSSTGTNVTIPSASGSASGVVTTGAQTFAGVKTFTSTISGSITGNAATATSVSGTVGVANGGTGQTTYTNGQLLIGNTTGGTLVKSTLTAGSNVTITNGAGSITISSTNTTYSAGTGITLSGTTFSIGQAVGTTNNVQFGSIGVGTTASGTSGEIRATNNITAYFSDKRLKTNIVPISDALDKVLRISGVSFTNNSEAFKHGYTNTDVQIGVIAQEVAEVLPEIVVPAPFDIGQNPDGTEYSISGKNYKTVQYDKLVPLLIEAIKELKQELDLLKGKGS